MPGRLRRSGGHSAVGAQRSHPGRPVVSLSGDGGLAMLLRELLTLKTHQLTVKVVAFDNSSLGMVRLEMPSHVTEEDARGSPAPSAR